MCCYLIEIFFTHIRKILLFTAHNLIDKKYKEQKSLLAALRKYLNLFMYTGLQQHTEETIEAGKLELENFSLLMKVCLILSQDLYFIFGLEI